MGLLGNLVSGVAGYAIRKVQDDNKSERDLVEEIRGMSLRDYLDAYRNAKHIKLNTNDADLFISELKEVTHNYELGI